MGCFGDMGKTSEKHTTSTKQTILPDWVTSAGQENYEKAASALGQGYQAYGGDRIAGLSSDEIAAGNIIRDAASSGNPYAADAASAFQSYGGASPYQFDFNTIMDESGPLGSISSYMNPYLQQVLDPSLRAIALQGSQQRQGIDFSAVMSGAFGDARHGVVESQQRKNEAQLAADTTGKGWADAFASALGLRSQDASRLFQTDQAQAAENKAALERMRQSGIDLTGLDTHEIQRALGLSSALGTAGQNARNVEQTQKDFDFSEFMRQQGFDAQSAAFLTNLLAGTPMNKTETGESTAIESKPNNSGWQALGTLASALFNLPFGNIGGSGFADPWTNGVPMGTGLGGYGGSW